MTKPILKYRVWFKVFDSFGHEIEALNEAPEIKDMVKDGIIMEAYSAEDLIVQAKFKLPMISARLPVFANVHKPLQGYVYDFRPEPSDEGDKHGN